jgi:small-conductance mechanosensitive channel
VKSLGRLEIRRSPHWLQPTVSLLLILLGAFCLLKYLGWAWVFSGNYGLPSHAGLVQAAQQKSLIYFWAGFLVEAALIANLTINIRFDDTELVGAPKTLARVLSALGIAVMGTLGAAFLLSWIGEKVRI